jgi:uncharacterized protein
MRVVLDNNTLVSAFLWQGTPAQLFDRLEDINATFLCTESLFTELSDVLSRPKFAKRFVALSLTPEEILADYLQDVEMVQPASIPVGVVRDKDDEAVLACAVGGEAEYIISGDRDLLSISSFQGISIITAKQCLDLLDQE